jgi:triosephosphate isomerase
MTEFSSDRKPFAVANWKMAMTVAEGQAFLRQFRDLLGDVATTVDVVLCPPYTALYPMAQALVGAPIQLGAQNLSAAEGKAHTGDISAELLADVSCRWVLVGHWEIRRRNDERDADVNRKLLAALGAGIRPILLVGESADQRGSAEHALAERLPALFAGSEAAHVARMAIVYEPEWTIGVDQPAPPDHVAAGCRAIRRWIAEAYNDTTADQVRIIYGGSVTPAYAEGLLDSPHVDGLGAGRKGRDPEAFAEIIRIIAQAKGVV